VNEEDPWVEVGVSLAPVDAVVHPIDPTTVFLLPEITTGVRRSTDGGVTWESRAAGLPSDDGVELLMNRANPSWMVAVFEDAGVFETTDAGLSWSDRGLEWGGADAVAACWGPNEESVIVATDDGVFVEGVGFVENGLTTRRFTRIAYSQAHGAILVGTERVGAWVYPLADGVAAPAVGSAPSQLSRGVRSLVVHDASTSSPDTIS
jgi:hypothetical protein